MESVAFVLLVQGIQDEKKRIKKEQDEEGEASPSSGFRPLFYNSRSETDQFERRDKLEI